MKCARALGVFTSSLFTVLLGTTPTLVVAEEAPATAPSTTTEANREAGAEDEAPLRTWSIGRRGQKLVGRILENNGGWLRIREDNGRVSGVQFGAVSQADRDYLDQWRREGMKRNLPAKAIERIDQRAAQREAFITGIKTALAEKDYDKLEALAKSLRTEHESFDWEIGRGKLDIFYAVLADEKYAPEAALKEWQAARPQSQTPLLALAVHNLITGWRIRGSSAAAAVPEDRYRSFEEYVQKTHELALNAKDLGGDDPEVFRQLLEAAKVQSWPREDLLELFEELMKIDPLYFPVHQTIAEIKLPRWGGDPGEMEQFAAELADRVGGADGEVLYARIAQRIAIYMGPIGVLKQTDLKYERIRDGLATLIERDPESTELVNLAAYYAWAAKDAKTAKARFEQLSRLDDCLSTKCFYDFDEFDRVRRWATLSLVGERTPVLMPIGGESQFVCYLPDKRMAVAGSLRGTHRIRVLDLESMSVLELGTEGLALDFKGQVLAVAASPQEVLFVGRSSTGQGLDMHVDLDGLQPFGGLNRECQQVFSVSSSAPDELYVTVDDGRGLKIWNGKRRTGSIVPGIEGKPSSAAFATGGELLAVGRADGKLALWDVPQQKLRGEVVNLGDQPIVRTAFAGGGKLLCLAQADGVIHLLDVEQQQVIGKLAAPGDLRDLVVSHDGKLLATAHGKDRVAVIWDAIERRETRRCVGHSGDVTSVSFSEDDTTLATGSIDTSIRLWPVVAPVQP